MASVKLRVLRDANENRLELFHDEIAQYTSDFGRDYICGSCGSTVLRRYDVHQSPVVMTGSTIRCSRCERLNFLPGL